MNDTVTTVNSNLNPQQAANYLGFALSTINNSRYQGLLGGVQAPPHKKIGKSIRYSRESLDTWLGQFKEQTSTSQN